MRINPNIISKHYYLILIFIVLIVSFLYLIYFNFYKIINYPTFQLKLLDQKFDIKDYSAFQGIDIINTSNNQTKVFFATGYAKSFVIYDENKNLFGEPLKSDVLDDPELLASVYAKDLNNVFWTSWRNGKVYLSNSDTNNFNYETWLSGFTNPIGIDGNESFLFISNHGAHEIHKYNYKKKLIWNKKFKVNNIELKSPYSIKIFNEFILISFQKPFVIIKADLDGNIIDYTFGRFRDGYEIDGSSFNNLQSIDFDNFNNLYAVDTFNKRIVIMDKNFNMIGYLKFNEANNWRGLRINRKNNTMYVTGFKSGLEGTESKTGFWHFEIPALIEKIN